MSNILKRQEIRVEIDGLKVKNPTAEQVGVIRDLIESNTKISEDGSTLEKINPEGGLEMIRYMLKNLVVGLEEYTDKDLEEAINDPSITLRRINMEFNDMVSEITQELLMATLTSLKEAKIMHDTNDVIEKLDAVMIMAERRKASSHIPLPKKKGRPKKKK